jgi:exodeoxyribonuclease-1
MSEPPPQTDPDLMLYSGGFFSDADRRAMERVRQLGPEELRSAHFVFQDRRLPKMLFRYRARNWPQSLSREEREEWDAYRFERLTDPEGGGSITVDEHARRLDELRSELSGDPRAAAVILDLERWAERVMDTCD